MGVHSRWALNRSIHSNKKTVFLYSYLFTILCSTAWYFSTVQVDLTSKYKVVMFPSLVLITLVDGEFKELSPYVMLCVILLLFRVLYCRCFYGNLVKGLVFNISFKVNFNSKCSLLYYIYTFIIHGKITNYMWLGEQILNNYCGKCVTQ